MLFLATAAFAGKPEAPRDEETDFGRDIQLAPFVVRGEQLPISIHARTKRDRKYAEAFADEVVKVVHESVTEDLGYGLVIVGTKREPHPIVVFRKFQEMAEAGLLDASVAAEAGALDSFLEGWQNALNDDEKPEDPAHEHEVTVEVEKFIEAMPLPLEGVGARLYQIAWSEDFDDAKVTKRLQSLRAGDLESDMFARFDWVFYLPHRGAFDQVMKEFIEQAMKEEEMGFLTRMAARTAITVFKPVIRRVIEGMRKGMMLMTVVRAQTGYSDAQVAELAEAYIQVFLPDSEIERRGSEHDTAVWAVRQALLNVDGKEHAVGD